MTRFRFVRSHRRGFTLVEIAVVLVIAGLLIAMVFGATSSYIEGSKLRATRSNMDSVRSTLQGFIARNGRLPCPAIEDRAPTANDYGIEATTPGTCTGTVDLPGQVGPPAVDAAKRGVVPWKSLGMTLENATDGWGNQLTYMVSLAATGKNFDNVAGMRGSLYVFSAAPVAKGLSGGALNGNQINACNNTVADDNSCNLAAVVVLISHGRNVWGAFTTSGAQALPLPTDAGELENTNADRFVVSAETSQTFDDLVLPMTPDTLLGPLATQGAIKGERALLQDLARQVVIQMIGDVAPTRADSLAGIGSCNLHACFYLMPTPTGSTAYSFQAGKFNTSCDAPYATTGIATGIVSDVPGSAAQILDPWGHVFKFGSAVISTGTASPHMKSDNACSTPVAIISLGPDGQLGTADDYVYYSPMAEWKEILGKVGW